MLRMDTIQYNLPQDRIPRVWYNMLPDLPKPMAPPLHPGTHKPIGPDDLAPLFPMGLILQEVSGEREIEIPDGGDGRFMRSGGPRRSTARAGWRRRWIRRRRSTTSTKA